MPVRDRNPFGPDAAPDSTVSKADAGVADPFQTPQDLVKCPTCAECVPEKIKTTTIGAQIYRTCSTCGNKWAGGSLGAAPPVIPGRQQEEEDIPDDPRLSGTERWFE